MESKSNEFHQWMRRKHGEGYSWEEIKNFCSSPEIAPEAFFDLAEGTRIHPGDLAGSECLELISREARTNSAVVLLAIFDQNPQHQQEIKRWLSLYVMQRDADLERIWFTGADSADKLGKYARGFHIALVSLDDPDGRSIGQRIYDANPDCLICYYRERPCRLEPLLHSRPYDFFVWQDGGQALHAKLDDMIQRAVFSSNSFCYETKKQLLCYPVRNIQYFQSDLKYVHIRTFVGNDATVYAKMSGIASDLAKQKLEMHFLQIHKSFIVNRSAIRNLNKQNHTVELSSGETIPISDSYYKDTVMKIKNGKMDGV